MSPSRGQAMVEFAMVIGVFLAALFAAFYASLYAVERSAAVTAVAAGARSAAGATAGDPNRPDLRAAEDPIRRVTSQSLFGTKVQMQYLTPGDDCKRYEPSGSGTLVACVQQPAAMPGLVQVRMVGHPRNPMPIPFFGALNWEIDVWASVHQVTFAS